MSIREHFIMPKRYKTVSIALMAVGLLAILSLYVTHGSKNDVHEQSRFWATLLHNSVYFLLMVNAVMFFICATTLAWGGWQLAFGRVSEAITAVVPVLSVISGIILLLICFSDSHVLYHWTDSKVVSGDKILNWKAGFLNKGFFAGWTIFTLIAWSLLGWKIRKISRSIDNKPLESKEAGKKYVWKSTVWAALFIIVFALTVMSSIPWLWLMSIDAHWYSTMYSWYTFASSFVAGLSLICLFFVFLKNNGYLEYATEEHLHDIGKFMFAFSIFWTYLWFSQYMLIWYSNQPEETTYFKPRAQGIYSGIFWLMFIINFLAPLLILMTKGSKRNYTTITFVALLIIFGHWLDFYQMIFPGSSPDHVPMLLYDFAVALGFAGLVMFITGRALSKSSLLAKNHPFIKESLIHHT